MQARRKTKEALGSSATYTWAMLSRFEVFVDPVAYADYLVTDISVVTTDLKKLQLCSSQKHENNEHRARQVSSNPFHVGSLTRSHALLESTSEENGRALPLSSWPVTVYCKGMEDGGCSSKKQRGVKVVVGLEKNGDDKDELNFVSEPIFLRARRTREESGGYENLVVAVCSERLASLCKPNTALVPTVLADVDRSFIDSICKFPAVPHLLGEKKEPNPNPASEATTQVKETILDSLSSDPVGSNSGQDPFPNITCYQQQEFQLQPQEEQKLQQLQEQLQAQHERELDSVFWMQELQYSLRQQEMRFLKQDQYQSQQEFMYFYCEEERREKQVNMRRSPSPTRPAKKRRIDVLWHIASSNTETEVGFI